jgi:hypothetical protein
MNTPVTTVKTINGYEWGHEIGKGTQCPRANNCAGAWGKVRMVTNVATGEQCAVKIIYRSSISRKIKNGVQLLYK